MRRQTAFAMAVVLTALLAATACSSQSGDDCGDAQAADSDRTAAFDATAQLMAKSKSKSHHTVHHHTTTHSGSGTSHSGSSSSDCVDSSPSPSGSGSPSPSMSPSTSVTPTARLPKPTLQSPTKR